MISRMVTNLIICITLSGLVLSTWSATASGDGNETRAQLTTVDIRSTIDNGYELTRITHHYVNPNEQNTQAHFRVMIPRGAFISNFSLTLDGQNYYARALPKEEAQERYEEAVAQGNTAGLGETRDASTFSFTLNLKAEQELTAQLTYENYLSKHLEERQQRLYLGAMDLISVDLDISINILSLPGFTGLNIDNYEDTMQESWEDTHNISLSISESDYTPLQDLLITYTEEPLPSVGELIGHYDPDTGEYYFMNLFSPEESELGGTINKDIVFVLDKSGSMKGAKISQLKEAFEEIIDQMPEDDRFNIIMFDNDIAVYKEELIDATSNNKARAVDHLRSVQAGGSTNLYDGLARALELLVHSESRAPIVVMLTDGLANSGAYTSPLPIREHIMARNTIMAPIFTLGFGDNVDFDFLSALSLENYAKAQQIYLGEDASEQIIDFYKTISTTLIRNIAIDYPQAAYDFFPESIPALYEGSQAVVLGKLDLDELDGEFQTVFSGRTASGQRKFYANHSVTDEDRNPLVKRFWTYAKIDHLMQNLVLADSDESGNIIERIENLAIAANFATPYTSMFIEVQETHDPNSSTGEEDDDGIYLNNTNSNGGVVDYNPAPNVSPNQDDAESAAIGANAPAPRMAISLLLMVALALFHRYRRNID